MINVTGSDSERPYGSFSFCWFMKNNRNILGIYFGLVLANSNLVQHY